MHPAYDKPLPEGWQGGGPITKYWGGNYVHLYRLTRACATCGAEISLDVTRGALDGTKKNAGLLLRNCPKCRAERKAGGVGSRGGRSRPVAADAAVAAPANNEELERLRATIATMKEELEGLYVLNKELRDQIGQRESAPATAAKAAEPVRTYKLPPEPLTMTKSTLALGAGMGLPGDDPKINVKMPWEGVDTP